MRSLKSARQSSSSLKIGVTGHRYITETEKLAAGIDLVLAAIERAYPGRDWTLLSPLAEGADRLVAWRALNFKTSARLVVPLPLAVDSYRLDFDTYESRLEFQDMLDLADEVLPPPFAPSREDGYYAAGEYVIRQADVVVALWDGRGNGVQKPQSDCRTRLETPAHPQTAPAQSDALS